MNGFNHFAKFMLNAVKRSVQALSVYSVYPCYNRFTFLDFRKAGETIMAFFAWFTFFAAMALYYRFLLILFKHLNESKTLKIFYSFVVGFLTLVLAKFIQILLGIVQVNLAFDEATDYAVWFGITIGLIIIYEAILRMIITGRDFQKIQRQQKFEELDSLMYKVDEYVRRGEWNQAHQLYFEIEALDIDQIELTLRCLEFSEQYERIGNLKASQFWFEKAG